MHPTAQDTGLHSLHQGRTPGSCAGEHLLSLPPPAAHCLLPLVRHGKVTPRSYFYKTGKAVTFTCHPGYTLRGPPSSTCGAGSMWNPPVPECQKGECHSAVSSAGRGESSLLCPLKFRGKAKPGWICPGFPSQSELAGREIQTAPVGHPGGTWGWLCPALGSDRDGEMLNPWDGRI